MSHTLILVLGYGVTWAGVVGYLWRLKRRERAIAEPTGTGGGIAA